MYNYELYKKYGLNHNFYFNLFNIISFCENKFFIPWYLHSNKKKMNYTVLSNLNKKNSTRVGILNIYELTNTFHFVVNEKLTNKVLFSYSSGMATAGSRNQRKNRYILELCSQNILYKLQDLNIKYLNIKIHNRIKKNLIKLFFKNFKNSNLKVIKFYDVRRKPHNGCLNRKARRL